MDACLKYQFGILKWIVAFQIQYLFRTIIESFLRVLCAILEFLSFIKIPTHSNYDFRTMLCSRKPVRTVSGSNFKSLFGLRTSLSDLSTPPYDIRHRSDRSASQHAQHLAWEESTDLSVILPKKTTPPFFVVPEYR